MKKLLSMAVAIATVCLLFAVTTKTEAYWDDDGYTIDDVNHVLTPEVSSDALQMTKNINNALDYVHHLNDDLGNTTIYTVKVPAGTRKIASPGLQIYSNTTLDLTDVTLEMTTSDGNMLMAGVTATNELKKNGGYAAHKNITILNGTFKGKKANTSTMIRIAHGTNIKIENTILTGGGCPHQMEVAAIDGFYLDGVQFLDSDSQDAEEDKSEALQLDIPVSSSVFKGVYLDGTPMTNVEIKNCKFKNVYRGLGTHTVLYGVYHTNINIHDNYFENINEEAVICLDYINCKVQNNTMKNCGAGILVQAVKTTNDSYYSTVEDKLAVEQKVVHNFKTVISGNTITTKYDPLCGDINGIKVQGRKISAFKSKDDKKTYPAGNYYISGVDIYNNTITTAGYGIHLVDTRNTQIHGKNPIVGANFSSKDANKNDYDGILISGGSQTVTVDNVSVKKMPRNGILVMDSSVITSITNSEFASCGNAGINLWKKSGTTGDISKNIITNAKYGGVIVSTNSSVGNIKGNTLTNVSGEAGITIYKSSTAGKITGNTMTNLGTIKGKSTVCQGIKITTSSTCKSVTGNYVLKTTGTYTASNGILVYKKSKVSGSITGNQFNNTSEHAIFVNDGSTVTGSISNNKLNSCKRSAIFIYKSSKVKKDVSENEIKKPKENGIYLSNKATVAGAINKNVIEKAGKKAILIYDTKKNSSTFGSITNNTITSSKKQAIHIYSIKNKVTISGNKISGVKENNILIEVGSTKYTITLKKNTIKGTSTKGFAGIRVMSGKININNNTISNIQRGVYTSAGVKGKIYSNKISKVKDKIFCESKKGLTFKK